MRARRAAGADATGHGAGGGRCPAPPAVALALVAALWGLPWAATPVLAQEAPPADPPPAPGVDLGPLTGLLQAFLSRFEWLPGAISDASRDMLRELLPAIWARDRARHPRHHRPGRAAGPGVRRAVVAGGAGAPARRRGGARLPAGADAGGPDLRQPRRAGHAARRAQRRRPAPGAPAGLGRPGRLPGPGQPGGHAQGRPGGRGGRLRGGAPRPGAAGLRQRPGPAPCSAARPGCRATGP